jgi:hypothetical protein
MGAQVAGINQTAQTTTKKQHHKGDSFVEAAVHLFCPSIPKQTDI